MSMIGTRVVRKEDPAYLTVGGTYVDDVDCPGALHAVFVRSVMAHADITAIHTAEAAEMPGVVGVYTAADLELSADPPSMPMLNQQMLRSPLATDRVRYVGEPFAVALAESREAAVDAAELVYADYEPLDAVVSAAEAAGNGNLLFPEAGTNTVFAIPGGGPDGLFDDCEVTVELAFDNPRLTGAPIEPRGALASWDPDAQRLTYWACTQFPHRSRDVLAEFCSLEQHQVHVITPDVGGGFGTKNANYVEDFVVARLTCRLGRPVRWAETRSECMLGLSHARAISYVARLGGTRDGDITAYSVDAVQDSGGYPMIGALLPIFVRMVASGVYDIGKVSVNTNSVTTNTVPVGAYRGAGRPEATLAIERMMDVYAAEIGMDPAELRRRNFVPPESFPFTTPTGSEMDSGEYAKALDAVMEAADYPALRAEQQRRLADGDSKLMGLGWCAYVEISNPMGNGDFGSMEVRPDGSALVLTGSSNHGQGHHTAFAQVASQATGIAFERIEVRHGDTDEVKRGGGTGGSRSLQSGGVAVFEAAEAVVEAAKQAAAEMLEADPADIVLDADAGAFAVAGTPARSLDWAQVATHVNESGGRALLAESDFDPPAATFPFGVQLSVVEVDRDTGGVTPLRHVTCDDAGVIVNPMIVEGQVHGGVASGIAHALGEVFVYDDDGNPLTGNFMDYAIASAAELPSFERIPMETPTDRNPLGVKGIGESGTIGATPAVQNAVIDALSHLGVRHVELPCTPERVWRHLQES
ncbi:xanthine dehydrogenase family protein molybdopterin-binding subunit [Candidatus Poriferisodalis sp.]|uniref:xanthine dehydrogenase family protein molybdopterin-binding subunit n=1 Tax=Candidatus Poriferisodalis sp. TaxID=3101277 RepID=UPI003B015CAC